MQLRNILLPLALGASGALADFWVFYEEMAKDCPGYRFLHKEEPSCSDVGRSYHWPYWSNDLSKDTGVRIWQGTHELPEALEVNTGRAHFTIYQHRNWGLYNLEDERRGNCEPFHDIKNIEWNCPEHGKYVGNHGRLVIYCETDDYDVTHFN